MLFFKRNTPNSLYAMTRLQQLPTIAVRPCDYNILEKPQSFHERILYHIKHAKDRIIMTMLYLQNDEAGREILEAIEQAKLNNPNLHVCIYVDYHRAQRGLIGKGNQESNSSYYYEYASKCKNPPAIYGVPVKKREIFGVLHLKGFVFDNTVLYSGASINNVYLGYKDKYRLDRYHEINSKELADTLCKYTNEAFHINFAVQDFCQGKIPDVKEIKDEIKQLRRHLVNTQYKINNSKIKNNQIGLTPIVGLGKQNNSLNKAILWLFYAAKTQIFICTPYFNPPKAILKAIDDALARGIKIQLVVGDKVANDFYIHEDEEFNTIGAIPYIYEQNLCEFIQKHQDVINSKQLTVHLWQDNKNTYHLKGIYVDRNFAIITGNNLNPRAWALDLENGIVVHDPNLLMQEKFKHEQQFILKHTKQINSVDDLQKFDDYPIAVKQILKRVKRFKASLIIKQLL